MNYWHLNYFREKKFLLLSVYFFACCLLIGTIYFVTDNLAQTNDSYYYYNEGIANAIIIIDLVCLSIVFLIFVYKILFKLKLISYNIPKVNNLILVVACGFIIALLVWYEFYYFTVYYHGEVKILSGYLISSSILLSIAITILFSNRLKNVSILFVIFAMLSYFFYECQLVILAQYMDIMNITF